MDLAPLDFPIENKRVRKTKDELECQIRNLTFQNQGQKILYEEQREILIYENKKLQGKLERLKICLKGYLAISLYEHY